MVLLLPLLAALVVRLAFGQATKQDDGGSPQTAAKATTTSGQRAGPQSAHGYSGWQNCHFCHRGGATAGADENEQLCVLVGLNESSIWLHRDKHAIAAKVLRPDSERKNLAYHMQQALGVERYQTLVQSNCQACHVAGEPPGDREAEGDGCQIELSHPFGVTCEACHGPAKDWIHQHWEERTSWRYEPPATKEASGFVNLRDPLTKAKKCLSCHVGNVRDGKFVTHEMYAAGHPPLAGFEVGNYSQAMPAHWTTVYAKSDERYKSLHHAQNAFAPRTRESLIGGLAALAVNVSVLAEFAASPEGEKTGPEFALYDCFACHHDLQAPSRRPLPAAALGRPGRPNLARWPNVAAQIALGELGESSDIDGVLRDLAGVLGQQAFGRRDRLRATAPEAALLISQRIEALKQNLDRANLASEEARRLDAELVERVLLRIGRLAAERSHDYDSARQLVWMFRQVYEDGKSLNPRAAILASVEQTLTELNGIGLEVDLPRGQEPIAESRSLAAWMAVRRRYDPRQFAACFARFSQPVAAGSEPGQR
jgi:hypothetical protein